MDFLIGLWNQLISIPGKIKKNAKHNGHGDRYKSQYLRKSPRHLCRSEQIPHKYHTGKHPTPEIQETGKETANDSAFANFPYHADQIKIIGQ